MIMNRGLIVGGDANQSVSARDRVYTAFRRDCDCCIVKWRFVLPSAETDFLEAELGRVQRQDDGGDGQGESQEGSQHAEQESHQEEELEVRHAALAVSRHERRSSWTGHRVGGRLLERHLGLVELGGR